MSTHHLCFGAKVRKKIPLHTPGLLYKSGVLAGHILRVHVFMMVAPIDGSCTTVVLEIMIRRKGNFDFTI